MKITVNPTNYHSVSRSRKQKHFMMKVKLNLARPFSAQNLWMWLVLFVCWLFIFWFPMPRFVLPKQRIVHFDLKGAPPKLPYFIQMLKLIHRSGATGILVEWEDMFPYTGKLAEARNKDAYSEEDVQKLLNEAQSLGLTVIPLVQTFGHLEWLLKLDQFKSLRDDPQFTNVICAAKPEAWNILQEVIRQIADLHSQFDMPFFHIGADEVYMVGHCEEAKQMIKQQFADNKNRYILWHMARTAKFAVGLKTKVLAWHDMIVKATPEQIKQSGLPGLIEPVVWNYSLDVKLKPAIWDALKSFAHGWSASSFKGANGSAQYHTAPAHYMQNQKSWLAVTSHGQYGNFRGVILTGWSRFDHFSTLCETLPSSVVSLVSCLIIDSYGITSETRFQNISKSILGCSVNTQGEIQVKNRSDISEECRFFPSSDIWAEIETLHEVKTFLDAIRNFVNIPKLPDIKLRKKAYVLNSILNGWMSPMNRDLNISSAHFMKSVIEDLGPYQLILQQTSVSLNKDLKRVFYGADVSEFLRVNVETEMKWLNETLNLSKIVMKEKAFPVRPWIK